MSSQPNVDPQEIAKFESMAASWWDPAGEFKPLHELNPLRLNYIDAQSGGIFDKQVLDVGCGGGILSESMARIGAKVTGWIWALSRWKSPGCMHWKPASA